VSISTFNSENPIGYAQSAGNLSFMSSILLVNSKKYHIRADKSPSETTRETSFNFDDYRKISGKNTDEISNDWLT
jgi:hypothetical protein